MNFIHRILYHQPFGILKYAMTLDGKLPRPVVTVPGSQTKLPEKVHQLRSACDAVIVGGNTLRQDNLINQPSSRGS